MTKQFGIVDYRYGAPMGRRSYGDASLCADRSIHLFRVRMVGDYDDGGAYWGAGVSLYCARDTAGTYRNFARAASRTDAALLLCLPSKKLIRSANHE